MTTRTTKTETITWALRGLTAGLCLVWLLASCGDDESDTADAGVDATQDLGQDNDVVADGSVQELDIQEVEEEDPCLPERLEILEAQASVSTGTVATTQEGDDNVSSVDASAGGMSSSHLNPYTYVSLATGLKAEVDDESALESTDWDIAFKRSIIRINGGDSGPGQGGVAYYPSGEYATFNTTPQSSDYSTDEFIDEDCDVVSGPIGGPSTAFDMWYDYNVETHTMTIREGVYVVLGADGESAYKFIVEEYDNGVFDIRWQSL